MVAMCMRKGACAIAFMLIGMGITLVGQRCIKYSEDCFPIRLKMTESEVIRNLGPPREKQYIFNILPPEEWPDSAKTYLLEREPSCVWCYPSADVYFASGKVCNIYHVRWYSRIKKFAHSFAHEARSGH